MRDVPRDATVWRSRDRPRHAGDKIDDRKTMELKTRHPSKFVVDHEMTPRNSQPDPLPPL